MAATITDVLNTWNDIGVFSYVIPFLLIFAVVFAILKKTGVLGDDNDGILAIISIAMGFLALQFDMVSEFYAIIFPRFGVGLSIFLVAIILIGFFVPTEKMTGFGYVIGIGVIIWALSSWDQWSNYGFGGWLEEYFWAIVVLLAVVGVIAAAMNGGGSGKGPKPKPGSG